jgi:exopolysaccharide biosynthesis polyprenyl glycosylphosphotransferase
MTTDASPNPRAINRARSTIIDPDTAESARDMALGATEAATLPRQRSAPDLQIITDIAPSVAPTEPIGPQISYHSKASNPEEGRRHPRRGSANLRRRLFLSDIWAVCISWIAVGLLVASSSPLLNRFVAGVIAVVATLLAARLFGLYRSRMCTRRHEEITRIVLATAVGAGAYGLMMWRFDAFGSVVVICSVSTIFTLSIFRWNYRRWLRDRRSQGMYLRRIVLVGVDGDSAELLNLLAAEPALGYEVAAVVGGSAENLLTALPISQNIGDIPELALSTDAIGILIVPGALTTDHMRKSVSLGLEHGLHVQLWSGLEGVGARRLRLTPSSGEAFVYVEPSKTWVWQHAAKRVIDIVGSTIGLIVLTPIILLASILVKLEDRGRALHRQERIGKDGRPFLVYKLRSMTENHLVDPVDLAGENERDGPLFKASSDPRVTRIGRVLRASSVDELPQLWNVLMGSMSLVGPRPALPEETAQFDEDLLRRLTVKPGLTGLWQIEARDNPAFNAYRRLDIYYVNNWTLSLDAAILVSTLPVVISRAFRRSNKVG